MKLKMFALFALGGVLASVAQPVVTGSYNYKLIIRDGMGFAFHGGNVSENYSIEVFDQGGDKVNSMVHNNDLATDGYNCRLSVTVGPKGTGGAPTGSQLTLVVTDLNGGISYRSSKVLPPLGTGFFTDALTKSAVGAFYADPSDIDGAYDTWKYEVGSYIAYPSVDIGGVNADYDGDGLTNVQEYQRGTDPACNALGMQDRTDFSIQEVDDGYEVEFNYDFNHVYSIRTIEGDVVVGRDGLDLEMFTSKDGASCGTFFGDFSNSLYLSGRMTRFVEKPEATGKHCIGLAVDGLLVDYIVVEPPPSEVPVTPGSPLEYATEGEATAALAKAVFTPSAAVSEALTTDAAKTRYAGMFSIGVSQVSEKWRLEAALTDEATKNLFMTVSNAVTQIDVGSLAKLPANVTTNVLVSGCEPGFYYSLYDSTTLTNLTADANAKNCNVLCGENGKVEFPAVKKPSDPVGFFTVGARKSPSVQPGDKRRQN